MVDPLSHWMHLGILPPVSSDEIVSWYLENGYRAVTARHGQPARKAIPPAPFTCVEAVKRALGLRQSRILTPYQLWKFLNKKKYPNYDFFP